MKNIGPIKMWSTRGQVASPLGEVMLTSELKAGGKLVLSDLPTRLRAPVTLIREALQNLEKEGLAQLIPHKEAVVVGIDHRYVIDYYVTRTILESEAAAMVCDAKDMTVLLDYLKRVEQVIEEERYQDYADADYDLHEAIWILVDNERMEGILKALFTSNSLARNTSLKDNVFVSFGEHKEIMKAIQMKNKQDVRKKMHAHMMRSLRGTLSKYEEQQEIMRFAAQKR